MSSERFYAPIALFIYERPDHVRRTIASLKACEGFEHSVVYVFADGPKNSAEEPSVHAARDVAHQLLGNDAVYIESERNRGLAKSIIDGVTKLCEQYGKVIVVEDDLVLAPQFLNFLNSALDHYEDDTRVMQVSGHMFDVPELRDQREALFLPMTTSWGWATWKRAWDHFDPDMPGWKHHLADPAWSKAFDLNGNYPYSRMLVNQVSGKVDSWAISWYYSQTLHEGLTLFPPQSLVANMGQDGSGTHTRVSMRTSASIIVPSRPIEIEFPDGTDEFADKLKVYRAIGRTQYRGLKGGVRRALSIAAQALAVAQRQLEVRKR